MRERQRSRARFIGVTGSSAKSTTVALLAHILGDEHKTYRQILSNGMPALVGSMNTIRRETDYFVAEVGVGKPGDMQQMADLLSPDIALITMINVEHYSAFRSLEAIAQEKGGIAEVVRPEGCVFLNADDECTAAIAERVKARIVTFGLADNADFQAFDIKAVFPERLQLKVRWRGGVQQISSQFVGEQFWLSCLAAFAIAMEEGVAPDVAAARIAGFKPIINRCGVVSIPGGPTFILDTVKAPLQTLPLSIDLLKGSPAGRKRIVLGQISDYSGNPRSKYRKAYRAAREVFDQVIFYGDHSHRSGASDEDKEAGHFLDFDSVKSISEHIKATAVPGEIILLKGSNRQHLERIALDWGADVACWEKKCGRAMSCYQCGTYSIPYQKRKNIFYRHKKHKKPAEHASGYVDEL